MCSRSILLREASTTLVTLIVLAVSSLATASEHSTRRDATQPNIVFILADDLGWNDVGFHGSRQVKTPNIDKLAEEGLILNNYYAQPVCSPSRAALMTGRYPIRTGLQFAMIRNDQRVGVPLDMKLLPQHLSDLGYENHAVGKWHLGYFAEEYLPTFRGFKTFYGLYNAKGDFWSHWDGEKANLGLDWHLDIGKFNRTILVDEMGIYSTRAFSARATKLISEHDFESKPLFLYLPITAPHQAQRYDPVQVPRDAEKKATGTYHVQRRKYLGMLSEMDTLVGQVRASLESQGVLDNTIIIFSSDNGGTANGQFDNWGSNFPLRSVKAFLYEGGVRVTGLIWGKPIKNRAGQVSTEMMHISDWYPTLYSFAGGNVADLDDIDSYDMTNVLTGNNVTSPRTEFVINFDPAECSKGMRVGKYKYLLNPNDFFNKNFDDWYQAPGECPGANETMIPNTTPSQITCEPVPRTRKVDLRCFSEKSGLNECLYDIENDPCEYYNLIDDKKYLSVKENILERIKFWEMKQVQPLMPPSDASANPKFFNYTWNPWTKNTTLDLRIRKYAPHSKNCSFLSTSSTSEPF